MFGRRMRAIARIPDVTTALSHYLLRAYCLRHRPIGKIARKLREIQIDQAGVLAAVADSPRIEQFYCLCRAVIGDHDVLMVADNLRIGRVIDRSEANELAGVDGV